MARGATSRAVPIWEIFPINSPVAPKYAIGRAEWKRSVAAGIANGANTAVPGSRKVGKTSACRAVIEEVASRHAMLPISLDLYEVNDDDGFLGELIRGTVAALVPGGSRLGGLGRGLLGRVLSTGMKELGLDPELRTMLEAIPDGKGRVEATLSLPARVSRITGKAVLLFIDEAQRISTFSEPFRRSIHRSFRDSNRVIFLLAGGDEGLMRELLDDPLAPVSGLVQRRRELDPIRDEEWRVGLPERFSQGGCSIDSKAVDLIIEEAKGVGASPPHSTMAICHCAFEMATLGGYSNVTHGLALRAFEATAPDLHRLGGAAA